MKIKCGRKEFELTEDDLIMYNGACYQLITRTSWSIRGGNETPMLAKAKARKLIKDGDLVECENRDSEYVNADLTYYCIKRGDQLA